LATIAVGGAYDKESLVDEAAEKGIQGRCVLKFDGR
jgi:hypothetical protein